MRFGEYLVEVGAVDESDVLTALAGQTRRKPFLPLLVVELGMISAADALRLLGIADAQARPFLDLAAHEGMLTDADLDRLVEAERESVPTLGTMLLAMGKLDAQTLMLHLEDYNQRRAARATA